MGNIARRFAGWPLSEAIECCADPDLLSARVAAHRAWQVAGSPSIISYLSEYLNGYEAPRHNRIQRRLPEVLERKRQSDVQLRTWLSGDILAERVVAWGRRDTPTADPTAIPGSAWQYLRIVDVRNSVVRVVAPAKTRIFDVRIFPIVESPDAIDRLEGRTFVEAFQMGVVDDPQVRALRKRAISGGCTSASFGSQRSPYWAVWPEALSEDPDGDLVIEPPGKSDEPTADRLIKVAGRVERRRFARLVSYLSAGQLSAEGLSAAEAVSVAIPRSIWRQDGIYIDPEKGDVLEVDPTGTVWIMFKGLVLRKSESFHRWSEIISSTPRQQANREFGKGERNIVTKTTSEKACFDWLLNLMRASPTVRPRIKMVYWRMARRKWRKSLGERGFERAWSAAAEQAPAPVWLLGGRPKKPSRPKPPHQ